MNMEELAKTCQEAIEYGRKTIAVQMPTKNIGISRKRKLCGDYKGKQPMGDILQTGDVYDIIAFDALDVMAFLAARGLVKVEVME